MRGALAAVIAGVIVAGVAAGAVGRNGSTRPVRTLAPPPTAIGPNVPPPSSVAGLAAGPPPTEARSAALAAALDPIWEATRGGCLTVSSGERVLYEANPDGEVVPASITKLLTGVAALEVLGQDARLKTSVLAPAAPVDGVVAGDLWLVGGGDPVLGTDAWAGRRDSQGGLHTSLDALADRVVAAGLRRVQGRVVGDESRYDADRYVDTWPSRLIADGEAGPLSALSVNDGFRVWGHPGIPFQHPPTDAAGVFTELLAARGVAVAGPPASGMASGNAVDIASIESPRVGDLVQAMLRDSDNETAELLVKELGVRRFAQGSTAAGVRAMLEHLGGRGPLPLPLLQGVVIADGSGLSDVARVTCRAVTRLLAARAAVFAGRLAVAGRDGTLARRFVDGPVAGRLRAKTGSLDGVAALAGYADNRGGAALSFAYIINGLPRGATGRALQDAVAAALVGTVP